MDRIFEFAGNHPILVSLFIALLIALFVMESRRGGKKVSPQDAVGMINRDEAVVVDIRDRKDFNEGRLTGSVNIPLNSIKSRVSELKKHGDKTLIIVDKMGQHSAMAVKILNAEGFANVTRLNGGIAEWKAGNLPLVKK